MPSGRMKGTMRARQNGQLRSMAVQAGVRNLYVVTG